MNSKEIKHKNMDVTIDKGVENNMNKKIMTVKVVGISLALFQVNFIAVIQICHCH